MDYHIVEIEVIFYREGVVNLVSLDGSSFYPTGTMEEDSSVYRLKINQSFRKKIPVSIYSLNENITELYKADVELPEKIVTEAFVINFY